VDLPDTLGDVDRAFLARLVERCRGDERVAALVLGGSHATGTADAHADLDLYLVTTDDGFDGVRAERDALLRSLGDVVFLEEHDDFGFLMVLYMYADGVHGEIALAPLQDLADVHAGPYVTLLDREGVLDDREFPAWRLDGTTRADILRSRLVWFWYDRRLLDVALARDDLWTAHHHLERCRRACVDLARLRADPTSWPGGYEKVERTVDGASLGGLAATVVPLEPDELARAAHLLTEHYRELGRPLADEHGVTYPQRVDERVTGRD
jgi:predicted nucleotidyltransferase